MITITIRGRYGITSAIAAVLRPALATCSNGDRLAVCLFFMADLPDEQHHLSNIEQQLGEIFPASAHGNLPAGYADFPAATVRAVFNHETRAATDSATRLWKNVRRGYWRNTAGGNRRAEEIIYQIGVSVQVGSLPAVGSAIGEIAQEPTCSDESAAGTPRSGDRMRRIDLPVGNLNLVDSASHVVSFPGREVGDSACHSVGQIPRVQVFRTDRGGLIVYKSWQDTPTPQAGATREWFASFDHLDRSPLALDTMWIEGDAERDLNADHTPELKQQITEALRARPA